MRVEFLNCFAISRDDEKGLFTGSLTVKLPDQGIRILGVYFSKRKDKWYFKVPFRKGIHHETGEEVTYPLIIFEEHEKQRAFIKALEVKGREFIENKLIDTENPLVFLKMNPKNGKNQGKSIKNDAFSLVLT